MSPVRFRPVRFARTWPIPSLPVGLGCGLLLAWVSYSYLQAGLMLGGADLVASDPPAHFTSGVLVYDYLRSAFGTDPLGFAESFYVRYPKVAIGHWPPLYYAIQAAWYGLVGVSPGAARLLSAVIALALAVALGRRLRAEGGPLALCAALALLALPWVQRVAFDVMSDLLTGLFVFLALLAFADLLEGRGRRPGFRFLGWSALAILTKGTAAALLPFAVLAPAVAGRARAYRAAWFWGGGLALAGFGTVLYLAAQRAGIGYPVDLGALLRRLAAGRIDGEVLAAWGQALPWPVHALALAGFLAAGRSRWRGGDPRPGTTDALVAAAFLLALGGFLLLSKLTQEPRAFLPLLAPTMLLAARGATALFRRLPADRAGAVAGLILALAALSGGRPALKPVSGYAAVAAAIPYPASGQLIVIGSDSPGEGAFIVERLVHDPRRAGVVLRAGALLTESNWMGTRSRPLFDRPEPVRDWLLAQPARYVVIDDSAPASPHLKLLSEAVTGDSRFRLVGRYPVTDPSRERQGDLRLYENPAAADRHPAVVRVRLGLDRGGRVLEYRWP